MRRADRGGAGRMFMARMGGGLVGILALLGATQLAHAEDAEIGALFEVTGPIANFVPPLLDSVKLAVDQVNAQGGILKGGKLSFTVADTQGSPQGAIDAATKLVNVEGVSAIVGALTSGGTIAGAQNVAVPAGIMMLSPTAT